MTHTIFHNGSQEQQVSRTPVTTVKQAIERRRAARRTILSASMGGRPEGAARPAPEAPSDRGDGAFEGSGGEAFGGISTGSIGIGSFPGSNANLDFLGALTSTEARTGLTIGGIPGLAVGAGVNLAGQIGEGMGKASDFGTAQVEAAIGGSSPALGGSTALAESIFGKEEGQGFGDAGSEAGVGEAGPGGSEVGGASGLDGGEGMAGFV